MSAFYAEWLVWALPFIAIPFTLLLSRWPRARNWFAAAIAGCAFLLAVDLLLEVQSNGIIKRVIPLAVSLRFHGDRTRRWFGGVPSTSRELARFSDRSLLAGLHGP